MDTDHFHLFYKNLTQPKKLVDSHINKHTFLLSQDTKRKFYKIDPIYEEVKDFLDYVFIIDHNYISPTANKLLNSYTPLFNQFSKLKENDPNYPILKKQLISHSSNLIDEINKLILKIFSSNLHFSILHQIKYKIFSINTLRIIIDPYIIKNIGNKDHKAYMLWCIGRALNNNKEFSSSHYFSKQDLITYLKRFYSTQQINSLLKHLTNKTFFKSINNDRIYYKGISSFQKEAGYHLKGNIVKIIPSLTYFRCLLTYSIAESSYIYDKNDDEQEFITDDLNNNNLKHGRSLIQISVHTSVSLDQVCKYLKFHPKKVIRYKSHALNTRSQAHVYNMNLHGSFIKSKDGQYYVLQRASNFYHSTTLKTVVFKQLNSVTNKIKLSVFKPKYFKSIYEDVSKIKTNQTLLLNKGNSVYSEVIKEENKRLRRYFVRKKNDPSIKPTGYMSYLIDKRCKEKMKKKAKLTNHQYLYLVNLKKEKKIRFNIRRYLDLSRVISLKNKNNTYQKISLFNLFELLNQSNNISEQDTNKQNLNNNTSIIV